ncbi:hypothetical protein EBU71_13490 [bacterium]|nr:hypothetical protein [Candidatus Elulimicrobium humile]
MTKQISYDPKITSANTQYNTISATDMAWLQTELIRYMALMGELSKNRDRDVQNIINQWYRKRTDTLPKSKDGQNTPESFIAGLLNNLTFGNQNDLSQIQMDALENISANMSIVYDAVIKLELQKKHKTMDKIEFRQKLFSIG